MKTFKIKVLNFEKHNPDRKTAYKKVLITNNIFNDSKVSALKATEKLLFIFLITQAGDQGSTTIALNERQISFAIGTGQRPESLLKSLQSYQLVTVEELPLIEEKRIERNRKEEKGKESAGEPLVDHPPDPILSPTPAEPKKPKLTELHWLAEVWNENCGDELQKVMTSASRMSNISKRIKETPEREYWVQVIKKVLESDFLTGKSQNPFFATFDWIISKGKDGTLNHVKVNEGNYSNKTSTGKRRTDVSPEYKRQTDRNFEDQFTFNANTDLGDGQQHE